MAAKSSQFIFELESKDHDNNSSTSPLSTKRRRCNPEPSTQRLLICDLNGVLVLKKSSPATYRRPFAAEFLRLMSKHFTIAIWSSARRKTIKAILKKVLPQNDMPFLFVWSQEKCELVNGVFHKPLQKVWNTFPAFNARNTVL